VTTCRPLVSRIVRTFMDSLPGLIRQWPAGKPDMAPGPDRKMISSPSGEVS
jgi:hypothetical protein